MPCGQLRQWPGDRSHAVSGSGSTDPVAAFTRTTIGRRRRSAAAATLQIGSFSRSVPVRSAAPTKGPSLARRERDPSAQKPCRRRTFSRLGPVVATTGPSTGPTLGRQACNFWVSDDGSHGQRGVLRLDSAQVTGDCWCGEERDGARKGEDHGFALNVVVSAGPGPGLLS